VSIELSRAGHPKEAWRTIAGVSLGGLVVLLFLGAFHHIVAPYAPGAANVGPALAAPSATFPFGTDLLGRDLWSETLHGLGVTISHAGVGFLIVLFAGGFAGQAVAHLLGKAGLALRLSASVLVSLPTILLAILLSVLLGREFFAFAVGLAASPDAFLRAFDKACAVRAAPYSDFARASGFTDLALLRRDLLHELRETFIATVARSLAAVTIVLSTMSFFGFGATPPDRDLGLMIASARTALPDAWWTAIAPIGVLMLFLLAARLAAGLAGGERP